MSETQRGTIILIGHSKGGVTKSTLCENLGAEFARQGFRVVLVDADHKQKTLSKWADRRNASIEEGQEWPRLPCFIKQGRIKTDLLELARDYDVVLVDTGGRESAELRSALLAADIVYVPAEASVNAVEALEELEGILEETEELNPERKVVGIIVRAPTHPNNREKKDAKAFMEDFANVMTLSRHATYDRIAYRMAPRAGASVIEWHDSKAKAEIQLIAQEILNYVAE